MAASIPSNVDMVPVVSSNIRAIGYAKDFRRLYVAFSDGTAYRYEDVPKDVFEAFLAAPSKGKFLWSAIRGRGSDSVYSYGKV